ETLHCPWEAKGVVMRVLAEESAEGRVELLDGIKVYGESGWVLVLPDSVDPVFHVVAESDDAEGARDLVAETVARIRAIQATAGL
ncbi:MAG: mannose-1-phosphate guanyltransferase, partial [Nitrospirae bacterium]|nr:mannose-1-phosphate guanyltransferase [Fimbriimonadaceae bacterium]